MAGHSKWTQIKRQKEVNDKARARIFSKLARKITLAVREGGYIADPKHNAGLRMSIEQAKAAEMSKETIQRAVEKGSKEQAETYAEVMYEAYGPGRVACLIVCTTDNTNRSFSDVRHLVEKHGGKMGSQGSVEYLFQHVGRVVVNTSHVSEEEMFQLAERCSAEDIQQEGEGTVLFFPFDAIGTAVEAVSDISYPILAPVEKVYVPLSLVEIEESAQRESLRTLITALEDLDDVETVYTNGML